MAATEELETVVRETLETRGVLQKLKARIRAEIYHALDDERAEKAQLSDENLMINELIKDYLKFNGYNYTHSVFIAETGQQNEKLSSDLIAQEMSLTPPSADRVPLLYKMVTHLKQMNTASSSSSEKPHPPDNDSTNSRPAPSSVYHHGNQHPSNIEDSLPAVVIEGLR